MTTNTCCNITGPCVDGTQAGHHCRREAIGSLGDRHFCAEHLPAPTNSDELVLAFQDNWQNDKAINALWDRMLARVGYDRASEAWSVACMVMDDEAEDGYYDRLQQAEENEAANTQAEGLPA